MSSVFQELIEGNAEWFDEERSALLGDAELIFLKNNDEAKRLTDAWKIGDKPFPERFAVVVARSDAEFCRALDQDYTHFVIVNSADATLNNRSFTITKETSDIASGDGFLTIRANPTGRRWFPPPTP